MVDFGSLIDIEEDYSEINPRDIFESLPKSSRINNLYDTQAEILRRWFEEARGKNDVVIELNTGGGKTLVGLLIALSTMRETGEGVLYLVDNKQLANQVVSQAMELGIPAKPYSGRASLSADFFNGETILVGAYQALFNGKSVFGVLDSGVTPVPLGGIIVDDAHASLDALKQSFALAIPYEGGQTLYKSVLSEFKSAFDAIDRTTTYTEFFDGVGNAIIEIPYEYWLDVSERVSKKIGDAWAKQRDEESPLGGSLLFHWPLIKDNLKYCQVVVSGDRITISALYPLLHMIPSFRNARRRVFMSATITDYGDMVRAYDLRGLTEEAIISLRTVSGVGRRMVLAIPDGVLSSPEFKRLIEKEVELGHGVVRLAPRSGLEFPWFETEEVSGHEQVDAAVKQLRDGLSAKPVSFINRYNGIDLPEDACRVLVVHDLPSSCDDVDALMSRYLSGSRIASQRVAQRIEQGVGRGVRGASDHCVVLLVGFPLQDWMKNKRNREHFSPSFCKQLEIGETICKQLESSQDYCDAMLQDIDSDDEWKRFHASRLARQLPRDVGSCLGDSFKGACLERKAFAGWLEHQNGKASIRLEKGASEYDADPSYRGWLLSVASRIAYDGGDTAAATRLLDEAHSLNREIKNAHLVRPSEVPRWAQKQAESMIAYMDAHEGPARLLQNHDGNAASLDFSADHNQFEDALEKLGAYLGFESRRADRNGLGPDVFWLSLEENLGLVIEAKNEKGQDTPLHKEEAGQLRTARDWLMQAYPEMEVLGVSIHPNDSADKNASAGNLLVLTPERLDQLIEHFRYVLRAMAEAPANERLWIVSGLLAQDDLGLRGIVRSYPTNFNEAARLKS